MKKQTLILILACLTIVAILVFVLVGRDIRATPSIEASSALVVNTKQEKALFAEDVNRAVPIASITKLMTTYLVLEAIHKKSLSWDEMLPLGRLDDPQAVSLYAKTGTKYYSVEDLFAAMLIMSANDAAEALAERVDAEHFTEKMNARAKEFGMSAKTHFSTASGLDKDGDMSMSTAADLMILTKRLLKDYPEVLDTTSRTDYVTKKGDTIHTTNGALQEGVVSGMDGLKTGYTDQAGYCFVGTAVQNGERVISITLGSSTDEGRIKDAKKMMEFGFSK
ncbi:D-alanyl-D-alanine carboxypeptidase family protein [Listeria newyorkensis]|uniref:D-alanyl-D-alanine carboxypeptidase n=1 Tax=Listeria newyorkensis TaxID=1497681 RepID=A0A841YU28_9LIST|nr:D-alanyl-D-alanine carboxypeptidase family protein [Listeria newyorkensis]MBC1456768.1 D-alanyl-D-alanine carboxypeptidase [Listeria newyorkensis]